MRNSSNKPPTEITSEAKTAIALAFEGAGGLKKLIAWARSHPALFYSQIYTKLIPLQVAGKIDATADDNNHGEYFNKLHTALAGIIAARRDEAAATTLDVTPNAPAPEPIIRKAAPPVPPKLTVVTPAPAAAETPPPPPRPTAPQSSIPGACIAAAFGAVDDNTTTTQKYIDWVNNGGLTRW